MNLLSIDPGANAGFAIYTVEDGYESGVWKNPTTKPKGADKRVLWNGPRFYGFMQTVRRTIRKKMIDGVCLEHNVMPPSLSADDDGPGIKGGRSDANAMLAGGWLAAIQIAIAIECETSNRQIFGPLMFTTIEWRSGYWGKYKMPPKEWTPDRKRAWHKQRALDACATEGWDVKSDDEAEALLMLVAFRKKMDPSFAFGRGGDVRAHQMGMAL